MPDLTPEMPAAEHFATAQEAETAFYDAFQRVDLAAMRDVWLEADYVECIHPMGGRLRGIEAVLASWRSILSPRLNISFELAGVSCTQSGSLSVHCLTEHITLREGDQYLRSQALVTNIYMLTERGWRMMLHHASPVARPDSDDFPVIH